MRLILTLPALTAMTLAMTGCDMGTTLPFLSKQDPVVYTEANAVARDQAFAPPPAEVPAAVASAEPALTGVDRVISRVKTGQFACSGNVHVHVSRASGNDREFVVEGKGFKHQLVPVVTATGAIRLENQKSAVVWLQVPQKAMLMAAGKRAADNCVPT